MRAHKQGEQQAEEEAGAPLSKEPDVGLDPRIRGLWPELKARHLSNRATQSFHLIRFFG